MKKILISFLLITAVHIAFGQRILKVDAEGAKLKEFYLKQHVETLWIAGHHINWETGEPDDPTATKGIKTHCSALRLRYVSKKAFIFLRPPGHKNRLTGKCAIRLVIFGRCR